MPVSILKWVQVHASIHAWTSIFVAPFVAPFGERRSRSDEGLAEGRDEDEPQGPLEGSLVMHARGRVTIVTGLDEGVLSA